MANKFQKMLFNLSTLSPIAFFLVMVWWLQCGIDEITLETGDIHLTGKAITIFVIGLLSLLYAFYSVFLVKISQKKLEIVPIGVNSIKSKGSFSFAVIIAYILPFSNLVLSDYNTWLSLSIVVIALLFLFLSNTVYPNPLLMLGGYHFYEISNINGSGELLLISKRNSIQDVKTIKKVITLWDYLMIEVK